MENNCRECAIEQEENDRLLNLLMDRIDDLKSKSSIPSKEDLREILKNEILAEMEDTSELPDS